MQNQPEVYFLLFVNSVSGGGIGRKYLAIKNKKLKFKSPQGMINIYLYDLFSSEDKLKGLKKAKKITQKHEANIIICGGDGTIIWVIEQVLKYGVNPDRVNFCVIPIGTGNDFSRSLNWGSNPLNFTQGKIDELKQRIVQWRQAKTKKFDLWDIHLITHQGGKILFPKQDQSAQGVSECKRTFSNYVGIGMDARVSYGFEKRRTRNKFLNLVIYGCLGFCHLFSKTQKINDVVTDFSRSDSESESQPDPEETLNSDRRNVMLLEESFQQSQQHKISKKSRCLVFLNCTSYMAGVKNVWNISKKQRQQGEQLVQAFDDGKIELVSFRNQLSLGLQRFIHACSKVGQGQGPFILKFNKDQNRRTYVHIDGQAMLTIGLKQIKITKSKITSSSQINVLYNNS